MSAEIISGTNLAKQIIEEELVPRVKALNAKGVEPKLVVVFVGDHPASASYIAQKEKSAEKAGILSEVRKFPDSISESDLLTEIDKINQDESIHGVIVQLPLPDHISVDKVINSIAPEKDADGFSAISVGKLFQGKETFECATPKGIITLLDKSGVEIEGQNAVVLGRSEIVGKPVSALLLNRGATVTTCHSRTKNVNNEIARADILVVAIGKPEFITGDVIPEGCVVVDVGIHRKEGGGLCGDVDFESASQKASKITPVPGGVGPMTVVSLIENTVTAAEKQQ